MPAASFLLNNSILPSTKRIGSVHHILQILLLGKNGQREAAERQQNGGKYCAFHVSPAIDKKLILSTVLDSPASQFAPDISA